MKVLLLDIDGVLNDHKFNEETQSNTILRSCAVQLNRIIAETDCMIVLISAWRYMILGGEMTPRGFEYLLRTHGIKANDRLIGYLNCDLSENGILVEDSRARLVKRWLDAFGNNLESYCVVDDLDLGFTSHELQYIQTDGNVGLTSKDADEVIFVLNG